MINIEVTKNGNENTSSVLRRFSRKVQGSGIVHKVRKSRYFTRAESPFAKKQRALKRIERRKDYEQKLKLGLVEERTRGRGGRRGR